MFSLHLQLKFETKLATNSELRIKLQFYKNTLKKYKIQLELQKIELRFGFRAVQLGGSPLFINTLSKSWISNENNLDAHNCATWQALNG